MILLGRALMACSFLVALFIGRAQYSKYTDGNEAGKGVAPFSTFSFVMPSHSNIHQENSSSSNNNNNNNPPAPIVSSTQSCRIGNLEFHLLRLLPNVILAGAAKSGTTTLSKWLLEHPRVLPTKKLECHFFTTGIHPREMKPFLLVDGGDDDDDDDYYRNERNYTSFQISQEKEEKDANGKNREELICQLRKRYLHQWPNLSSLVVATHLNDDKQQLRPKQSTDKSSATLQNYFTFDKTPDYLYPSRVPALIRALLFDPILAAQVTHQVQPPLRPEIVVILRNPIDRAYSQYRQDQRMMREQHIPFETFVQRELQLLHEYGLTDFEYQIDSINNQESNITTTKNETNVSVENLDTLYDKVSDQLKGHNYLSRSLYATQLERWFRHGLGDDLLVLPYSWLASQPCHVYTRILEFAGMSPHDLSDHVLQKHFNRNTDVQYPLSNNTRNILQQFFALPNQALVDLLTQHNQTQDYEWGNLGFS